MKRIFTILTFIIFSCSTPEKIENNKLKEIERLLNQNTPSQKNQKNRFELSINDNGDFSIKEFINDTLYHETIACIKQIKDFGTASEVSWDPELLSITFMQKPINPDAMMAFYEENQIKEFDHINKEEGRHGNYLSFYIRKDEKAADELIEKFSEFVRESSNNSNYKEKW